MESATGWSAFGKTFREALQTSLHVATLMDYKIPVQKSFCTADLSFVRDSKIIWTLPAVQHPTLQTITMSWCYWKQMLDIGIFADMLQEEARATPPHLPVRWGPCSMPFLRPGNCFLRIRLLQDSQVLSLDCEIIHISSRRSITYFFSTFCWQRRRLCIHNLHNQCCNIWGRKGLHKGEHLVKDDSHWPNINLGIVWFVFANLWRKILGRPNLRFVGRLVQTQESPTDPYSWAKKQQCHSQQWCLLSPLRFQNLLQANVCILDSHKKQGTEKYKRPAPGTPIFASPACIMKIFWDFMSPRLISILAHLFHAAKDCNGRRTNFWLAAVEYTLWVDVLQRQQTLAENRHCMRFREWLFLIFVFPD